MGKIARRVGVKVCLACDARFAGTSWRCPACSTDPAHDGSVYIFAPEFEEERDDFDPALFRDLASLEDRSFWFVSRNRLIDWTLRKHFPSAASFCEVGCGTGSVLRHLHRKNPQLAVAGADLYRSSLRFAEHRLSDATLYQLDARRMPFEGEFDVIGAFDVLEHIAEDGAVLAQLRQALVPGGGLIVTVPQHPRLWSAADDLFRHKRRYTRAQLVEVVRASGFSVERVTSFVSLLLPLMAVSRLRQRRQTVGYDPLAEHRLPPALQAALGGVLAVERLMIRLGMSLPAGGSLLLVARRT
jgi:SAM-dependent methyltransferase